MRKPIVVFVFAIGLAAAAATMSAASMFAELNWTGGDGNWDTDASWDSGTEPTAADNVHINGATVEVTEDGEVANNVYVGDSPGGTGGLVLNGGTLEVNDFMIASLPLSEGSVEITNGSITSENGDLGIGTNSGSGELSIGANGFLDFANAAAALGDGNTGILNLTDGGLFATLELFLGGNGGTATVNFGRGGVAGNLFGDLVAEAVAGITFFFDHVNNLVFSPAIPSGVTVTKSGPGSLTFTGANAHAFTTVNGGTLIVNGNQPTSGVVLQDGTVGGTGQLGEFTVTGSGTIAPGESPGILTAALVTMNASTTFFVDLDGAVAGTGYDQLAVLSGVTLANAVLDGTAAVTHAAGTALTIIDNQGATPVDGTFSGLAEGATATIGAQDFVISYIGGDGNDVTLTAASAPVLAPPTLPDMTANVPFSVTITASEGLAPYAFAVTAGALPTGLTLDASTGELAGTPTEASSYSFTITVTDALATTGSQAYSGDVAAPVPALPVVGVALLAVLLAGLGWIKTRTQG